MSRWSWSAFVGALSLGVGLGCAATGAGTAASSTRFGSGLKAVPASPETAKAERAMFARVNEDRAEHGLRALTWDDELAAVARHHSADMRDHGFFEHQSPSSGNLADRLDTSGYLFEKARENLSEARDVQTSQEGLLASPHHFDNLMAQDITHVGIGIVKGGVVDPQNLSVTQVFATPLQRQTVERARASLLERLREARKAHGLHGGRENTALADMAKRGITQLDASGTNDTTVALGIELAPRATRLGLATLVLHAQSLFHSKQWVIPEWLATEEAEFGLAVREVELPSGHPGLQVLVVSGTRR